MCIAAATAGTRRLLWDDYGPDGAAGGRGQSDTEASGVHDHWHSTSCQAHGNGPTRLSDARDSEPTNML